ncbi:NAD(P)H-quinone oxidoreductase subunit K chloroplastic [Bienertia sinuspersici]
MKKIFQSITFKTKPIPQETNETGLGAPSSKGPEKLSSYESGIEPMGDAWLQFRIRYYMFALVFVVFDVETIFLYPWAMSFDILGVSAFIEAFIFVLILIVEKGKNNKIETVIKSIEFPLLDRIAQNSVISTTSNDLSNWSRLSSLWLLLYGSRFHFDRYGLVPRLSPRQADLILTAGTVTMKMAPSLVRLYEQMLEPKYVIAMGACTITGGMFSTDSYIIDAITKLHKKSSREIHEDRIKSQQKNRCFTFSHKFRVGRSIHTGNYDQGILSKYKSPSTSEIPTETFFKYKSSASSTEFMN